MEHLWNHPEYLCLPSVINCRRPLATTWISQQAIKNMKEIIAKITKTCISSVWSKPSPSPTPQRQLPSVPPPMPYSSLKMRMNSLGGSASKQPSNTEYLQSSILYCGNQSAWAWAFRVRVQSCISQLSDRQRQLRKAVVVLREVYVALAPCQRLFLFLRREGSQEEVVQSLGRNRWASDHLARCCRYSSLLTSQFSLALITTAFSMISLALLPAYSKPTVCSSTLASSPLAGRSLRAASVFLGRISTKLRTFCQRKHLQSGWQSEQKQLDCVGMGVLLQTIYYFSRSMFSKSTASYLPSKDLRSGWKCSWLRRRCLNSAPAGPVSGYRKAKSYYLVPRQQTSYSNSSSSYSIINQSISISKKSRSTALQPPKMPNTPSLPASRGVAPLRTCGALNQIQNNITQMSEKLSITFDEENNIRVLDPEKFRESDHLKGLSMEFITKVITMDETMSSLTECLDDFAVQIEKEKLRALGERNKWESETENRKRKMMELNNLLNEKKAELERYTVEYDSLVKVEAEQKTLINKLSSNQ